jgi:DNA polymerase-3 subunit epsilon
MYGIASNTAHRALDDVMVLFQVFTAMVDDLSIEKALELLNRPKQIRQMPFGKHRGTALEKLPKEYIDWLAGSGAFDKEENFALRDSLKQLGLL